MNPRVTLALVAVAAALGAYLWLVEFPREGAEADQDRVLEIEAGAVTALEVPLEGGGTGRIVRRTDGASDWLLEAPVAFAADDAAVDRLVDALVGLDQSAALAELPDDLEPFGLATRERTVRVWTGEADPIELVLGGAAPIGSTRYVLRSGEQPALFTVGQGDYERLQPELKQLRDKRVVRLAPGDVDALRVSLDGATLVAVERGGDPTEQAEPSGADPAWRLIEPVQEPADSARILRLIQDVAFSRAVEFFDGEVDAAKTGLDAPVVELTLAAGERTERVAFGRAEEGVYAQVEGRDVVFEVPQRVLDSVPRELFAYRFKKVLEVGQTVDRIDLYFPRDGLAYAFSRSGDGWAAEAEDVEVTSFRVEDVLYAVRSLDASDAEEPDVDLVSVGLEPPWVRVTLRADGGEELGWLELGDLDLERGIAARSSQSGRLWRVPSELAEDVPLGLEAFDNRWNTWTAPEEPSPEVEGDAEVEVAPVESP